MRVLPDACSCCSVESRAGPCEIALHAPLRLVLVNQSGYLAAHNFDACCRSSICPCGETKLPGLLMTHEPAPRHFPSSTLRPSAKMRLPLPTREPFFTQTDPRIDLVQLLLFSGDAFSYVNLGRVQSDVNRTAGRHLPAPRRACTLPSWMACVSRSIGNSDTTAWAHHWQVGDSGPGWPWNLERTGGMEAAFLRANTKGTTRMSGASALSRLSLASQHKKEQIVVRS
jgi:hypothetical protein